MTTEMGSGEKRNFIGTPLSEGTTMFPINIPLENNF